jgi:hypothetical protein
MLLMKGGSMLLSVRNAIVLRAFAGVTGGLLFYWKLFSGISLKHARRIIFLKEDRPCVFSFFSWHSYFLMILMIAMGITLRKSGLVPVYILSVLYLSMGIPLLMSSIRFYSCGFRYPACREREMNTAGETSH